MSETLISVVLITYNRPDRLPRAIQTVLDQTYKNLEIIIVDGANSPENKKVVESFQDPRILYTPVESWAVNLYSQYGMQHSRNVGCRAAKGDYIAMLDDDDAWKPDKIKTQLSFAQTLLDPALVLCYTEIHEVGDSEDFIIDKTKTEPTYLDLLRSFNLSSTSAFFIKRSVLEEIGYWDETLRGAHEYDIALHIAKKGYRILTVEEPLMIRYRYSNLSSSYYYIKIAEVLDFWRKYGRDFLKLGPLGYVFNVIKTIGLFGVYLLGYIIKEKTWRIIYPIKTMYEQRGTT